MLDNIQSCQLEILDCTRVLNESTLACFRNLPRSKQTTINAKTTSTSHHNRCKTFTMHSNASWMCMQLLAWVTLPTPHACVETTLRRRILSKSMLASFRNLHQSQRITTKVLLGSLSIRNDTLEQHTTLKKISMDSAGHNTLMIARNIRLRRSP